MIEIAWDRINGVALPEGKVWDYVDNVIVCHKKNPQDVIRLTIGSSHIIDAFRVCLKKAIITPEEIEFLAPEYNGTLIKLPFDKRGRSGHWPLGFCDLTETLLDELLNPY